MFRWKGIGTGCASASEQLIQEKRLILAGKNLLICWRAWTAIFWISAIVAKFAGATRPERLEFHREARFLHDFFLSRGSQCRDRREGNESAASFYFNAVSSRPFRVSS